MNLISLYTAVAILAAILGIVIIIVRALLADKQAAREHELKKMQHDVFATQELGDRLAGLEKYLRERQQVTESALKEFLAQVRDVVAYTQERRLEAERKATQRVLPRGRE